MNTTKNNSSNGADDFRLTISRIINAPCALVFRAWTEPDQLVQWWGPAEMECRSLQADVKTGGAYRIHIVSPKGERIAFGKYTEIVPNRRVQFTWQWESYAMPDSVVTVDFEDLGKTTRLTLTHAGLPDAQDVTEHNYGWSSLVEKFSGLMEQGKIKA